FATVNVDIDNHQAYVALWDARSAKEITRLPTTTDNMCTAFSPDGKDVATGDHFAVRFWTISKKREASAVAGHIAPIHSIAFTQDGKRLGSAVLDQRMIVWDSSNNYVLQSMVEPGNALALGPDDLTFYAARDGVCLSRNLRTGDAHREYRGRWHYDAIAVSVDGKLLAAGAVKLGGFSIFGRDMEHVRPTYQIWKADTGECCDLQYGNGRLDDIRTVAISGNRRFLAVA